MRLYLINPSNPLVSMAQHSRWRKYRVWKPLGLMVIAALSPSSEWDVTIIDENLGVPDYASLPRPDLVGITAFTSQAPRAYQLAAVFRVMGVPVVMGGIHASMCSDEALEHVDTIVRGEAESVWRSVLSDARHNTLKRLYVGESADLASVPPARHDLLAHGYAFGSIQTTRGCPLNCHFCSVSAFNGHRYRYRPIESVIDELATIPERMVLVVDDNLIGTRAEHIVRAKKLFRAMIDAGIKKKWICQATINLADDEELLQLAQRAGCIGVFIGFETTSAEGLAELGKRYNILKGGDPRASVKRIHRYGISIVGSFIMGLDSDDVGVGRRIAEAASYYGVDLLNAVYMTPLPGTRLWDNMNTHHRITANRFPEEWRYYTLGFPVARHRNLSWHQLINEMDDCCRRFYSPVLMLRRIAGSIRRWRSPLTMLVANLSYRRNHRADRQAMRSMDLSRGAKWKGDDSDPDITSSTNDRRSSNPKYALLQANTVC